MALQIGLMAAIFVVIYALHRFTRCLHPWELVDKTEFPAPIVVWRQVGLSAPLDSMAERLCKRTVVLAWRCPKCGATKIFREQA